MSSFAFSRTPRWVPIWLFVMVVLVMVMVVVGGATRLTNSGLSITEWAPIRGALPPLSEAQWLSEFEKYKQIPEFEAEHPDMDMAGFRFIYFWEWAHRQLGRIIGLVYAIPFLILAIRRQLPKGRGVTYTAILFLIGLQGAIGWWMVYSGLQEGMVAVSQYRLATHLGMAFVILGLLIWLFLDVLRKGGAIKGGGALAPTLLGMTFVQIVLGAFVAGTQSGKTYNTWPLMDGDFVPDGYFIQEPAIRNLFENPAAIQFNHRTLAYIILVLFIVLAWRTWKEKALRLPLVVVGGFLLWQTALGIWTLLSAAPLSLALKHQASAVYLFVAMVWLVYKSRELR
jgi:cytochrome c oxidase assembly protein subunit 15